MSAFKILSLDGGGIRGAFTAACLVEIEKSLDRPIAQYFDLIAGTSTGAIVAAALAFGKPATEILRFYQEKGRAIFAARPRVPVRCGARLCTAIIRRVLKRHGIDYDDLIRSRYAAEPLRSALEVVFEKNTLEAVRCSRLVVPAIDLAIGRTVVFKTPHLPDMSRDRNYPIADVLLATTAAPTYFPQATIGKGSAYCDGGLWANSPGLVAVAEALKIGKSCKREGIDQEFDFGSIQVLSIGTGLLQYSSMPPAEGPGLAWWGPRIVNVMSIAQAQGVDFQLQYLLQDRYLSVNFNLNDASWKLDAVQHLDALIHQGEIRAHEKLGLIRERFCSSLAVPYTPFP